MLVPRILYQMRWIIVVLAIVWSLVAGVSFAYEPVRDLVYLGGSDDFLERVLPSFVVDDLERVFSGRDWYLLYQWFGQSGSGGILLAAALPAITLGRAISTGVFTYDLSFPLTRVQIALRYLGISFFVVAATYAIGSIVVFVGAALAGIELPSLAGRLSAVLVAYLAVHGFGALCVAFFGDALRSVGASVLLLLVVRGVARVADVGWVSPFAFVSGLSSANAHAGATLAWAIVALVLHGAALFMVSRREA